MNIQGTFTSVERNYIEVTIENIADDTSDDMLVGWAMRAIGEYPSRFFDWAVTHWPLTRTATVTLYRS